MRLIDADDFGNRMYHEAFEKDSDLQKWDSGCWIRYKLFEKVLREQPTVEPEIIRCRDCDWWTKQEDSAQGRCELMQMYPAGGWYCGNARRRGGDSDE